ncbi:NfrA family protein [Silvimonas iriomotensis]|uniref:Phage receptor n=1 Tax=Silvimonas iriomotensis TaxID=449662 RepID=A0ABQ2PCG4_9NEIS|nr:tetratricopeptide repeat protein [Silvimonas iriomotensis]GGP23096.1 phage receptor [Silvimonas iriomotensis]
MKTRPRLLPALIALALAAPALAAPDAAQRIDLGSEVTGYRRFIIYPHLEKAFSLQQRGDMTGAIGEFKAALKLAPNNATLALYLADAYERNGQPDQALTTLRTARQAAPQDARIVEALAVLQGVQAAPATPTETAPAQPEAQPEPAATAEATAPALVPAPAGGDCQADQTAVCKAIAGNAALRLGKLADAQKELDDTDFAATPEGISLRHALVQRAIFLRDTDRALAQLAILNSSGQLTVNERSQWINLLLAQGRLSEAEKLLAQAGTARPRDQLAYAQALAQKGDTAALARYLGGKQPRFQTLEEERQWMNLLQRADNSRLYADYKPAYAANRQEQAKVLIPVLLSQGDDNAAQRLLEQIPADQMLQERFALSIKANQLDIAQQQALALLDQRNNDPVLLDSLSYQLISAGGQPQAVHVLVSNWPFENAQPARRSSLLKRLADLVNDNPALLSASDRAALSSPLGTPGQRGHQAAVFAGLQDCAKVHELLGDLSSGYNHDDWMRLGNCYMPDQPGLAQYAYEQAAAREDDVYARRSLAYAAFASQDYPTALQAWQSIKPAELMPAELISATTTALAANGKAAAKAWLDEYQDRGAVFDDEYWWLRAQDAVTPAEERDALNRAIAYREDARYYARLATLQSADKQYQDAVASLKKAEVLSPDDPDLQATLGYAYWFAGDAPRSRVALENARATYPDDIGITQQLVYSSQRMVDNTAARAYARDVIDWYETIPYGDRSDDELDQEFGFKRLHEDLGRRWSFSAGAFAGTNAGSIANAPEPGNAYRSYSQVEADYRLGDPAIRDGKTLEAYARVFAGSGNDNDSYQALPIYSPMLGTGIRWKPLRDWTFFLAAEYQTPLDRGRDTVSDFMLRASASLFNDGKYSDDWHESGTGWVAQNLYLDAAYYLHQERTAATADYRVSYHQKIERGQTIEPYTHIQYNLIDQHAYSRDVRAGAGVRWNYWYGEKRYDAYPSKISVGLEFQHAFNTYLNEDNTVFLTFGGLW